MQGLEVEKLIEKLARRTNSSPAHSLPPECYHSQAFFEAEVERIFERSWLSIAHVSQIPNPGDYVCHDLLGEQLLITRDQSNEIHVMSRTCLHRWTEVVSGAGNTERFVCPFHAWTYALDGRLLGAPVTRQEPGFEPEQCRLAAFHHEVHDGFVFVNLDGQTSSLAPAMQPLSERSRNYRPAELKVAGVLSYECEYNWKIVVETFMEAYHHPTLHPETIEPYYPARTSYAEPGGAAYAGLHTPVKPSMSSDPGRIYFPMMAGLTVDEQNDFVVYNVYPCHLLSLMPDAVYWFRTTPVAPDHTKLDCTLLLPPELLQADGAEENIEEVLHWVDVVNQEDIAVNVTQQRGLTSRRARPGRLNHLEEANIQFADYVGRMMV